MKFSKVIFMGMMIAATTVSQAQINVKYTKYELPNGMEVILHQDRTAPLVTINIWYKVGSGNEEKGRTGFAHLFEHMMFQGSANVGDDMHFKYIQQAGGTLNGSTNPDRTNYFETLPSNYLEMGLWLESDRMGFLLPAMTLEKLNNQREVVKNERRQRYENSPYGLAFETIWSNIYPPTHPYSWTTIGSMDDLNAASMDDISTFFKRWYSPANASLVIAGDFDIEQAKQLVEKYFSSLINHVDIQKIKFESSLSNLTRQKKEMAKLISFTETKSKTIEDNVQLPRLYMVYHSVANGDKGDDELDVLANVLTNGKKSKLYKRLVYEKNIAKDVSAFQYGLRMGGGFYISVTANPGVNLTTIRSEVDQVIAEVLAEGITENNLVKAVNNLEASQIYQLESVASLADRLNYNNYNYNEPNYFSKELEGYKKLTVTQVNDIAKKVLSQPRFELSIVPKGKTELSAEAK